jgi:hypothetical protein
LALHIVETKRGDFEAEKFEDQYEDALKELLRKKQKGEKIERPNESTRSNVVNLMDALRESVQAESARGSERRKLPRAEHRASKRQAGSHAAQEDRLNRRCTSLLRKYWRGIRTEIGSAAKRAWAWPGPHKRGWATRAGSVMARARLSPASHS